MSLTETILKSRAGVYKDTPENRRLHRVGQRYGEQKQGEEQKEDKKATTIKNATDEQLTSALFTAEAEIARLIEEKATNPSMSYEERESVNEMIQANERVVENYKKELESRGIQHRYPALEMMSDEQSLNGLSSRLNQNKALDRMRLGASKASLVEVESKMSENNKEIALIKREIDRRWKLAHPDAVEAEKEAKDTTAEEAKFSRVNFPEMPNAGKVNLKKYLSEKGKQEVEVWTSKLDRLSDEDLNELHGRRIANFNRIFNDASKSNRAKLLYEVMRIKAEIAKRSID